MKTKSNLLQSFLLATLILLLPQMGAAQNYIVNYYGLNLAARDLVYYPAQKQFIINTVTDGQLGYINSEGRYKLFLKDSLLAGSTAVKIRGNFLYALSGNVLSKSNTDSINQNRPKLVKVNLLDKSIASVYELDNLYKGAHFLTDLAIDPAGVIYISDALSPVIYKIDTNGVGSVLLENDQLRSPNGQVNAIAYHRNGYLLVAVNRDILKINLSNLNSVSAVYMDEFRFSDINSLHFTPEHLLVVSEKGSTGKVHILNSSDSWVTGNVLRTDDWTYKTPVNIEFVDNRIYVLDSNSDKIVPSDFSVRVIDLHKLPTPTKKRNAKITTGHVTVTRKDF